MSTYKLSLNRFVTVSTYQRVRWLRFINDSFPIFYFYLGLSIGRFILILLLKFRLFYKWNRNPLVLCALWSKNITHLHFWSGQNMITASLLRFKRFSWLNFQKLVQKTNLQMFRLTLIGSVIGIEWMFQLVRVQQF